MATRGAIGAAFGSVVREQRIRAALSQEQLAEMANLHRNYVGMVERGASSPSLSAIVALSRALGTRASDLIREAEARTELPPS